MNLRRILMTLPILALVVSLSSVTRGGEPVSTLVPPKSEYRAKNDSYSTASVPFDKALVTVQKAKPFQRTALIISSKMKVLFLARTRPVSIDVTFTWNGKSLVERWTEAMREAFKTLDRDGSGDLNAYEVEHIFTRTEVRAMLSNGYSYRGQAGKQPKLADLDIDQDGRVSFDEFLHYYEHEFPGLIRTYNNPQYSAPDQITPEIFARLDRNGDGKISEEEFKQAEKLLADLDTDEDETVSVAEFLANPIAMVAANPLAVNMQGGAMMMRANPNLRQGASDLQVFTSEIPGAIIQKIIAKYDKDGDFELTRKEIGFSEKDFKRIDKNGDGKLTATELDAWRNAPADLEAEIALDEYGEKSVSKVTAGKGCPEGISISKSESSLVAIVRIDGQVLDLGTVVNIYAQQQRQYQQFDYLFMNGKTYLTESELATPQNQYLRVLFDVADFNGDGRLTKEELNRYMAMQARIASVAVIYMSSTKMPSLFDLMDTNKDGKLSVRELRNSYKNLIAHEPTGGTEITSAILQPAGSFRASFGPNPPYDYSQYQSQQRVYQNGNQPNATPGKGPIWFRKMDRNGDGDVSPSEFIGTKDDFKLIDTNGDGLISLEEAIAYDEKLRGEKK